MRASDVILALPSPSPLGEDTLTFTSEGAFPSSSSEATITFTTRGQGEVLYVASTAMEASVKPSCLGTADGKKGTQWVTSFTVKVGAVNGLVAVGVCGISTNHTHTGHYFFIPYFWKGGVLHVATDTTWIPPTGKMGQILLGGEIQIVCKGERYSSRPDSGLRIIEDPNLMVRWLAGLATDEDIEAAATARVEEVSARERVKELEGQLAAAYEILHRLERERDRYLSLAHQILWRATRLVEKTSGWWPLMWRSKARSCFPLDAMQRFRDLLPAQEAEEK